MITGRTKIIAHLGVPTESFKAPMIYNPWFDTAGVDCVVVPMGSESEDFSAFLPLLFKLRNIAGALVTMPHKVTAATLMDIRSPAVEICGACNAVRRDAEGRLHGDMFDGEGFVRGLLRAGRTVGNASALVVGAGGVGSAIAASLASAGAARISLFDLDPGRADALAARLKKHFPSLTIQTDSNDPSGHDIVVNATPLGMNDGDPMPMDIARISPDAFVGEVVMKAEETAFLAAARGRGCKVQIGTDMLFEQIPAYLEFFGFTAPHPDKLRKIAQITY